MGFRYPLLPSAKIVTTLKRAGFEAVSQKGSHLKLRRAERSVIVPMHDEVARAERCVASLNKPA